MRRSAEEYWQAGLRRKGLVTAVDLSFKSELPLLCRGSSGRKPQLRFIRVQIETLAPPLKGVIFVADRPAIGASEGPMFWLLTQAVDIAADLSGESGRGAAGEYAQESCGPRRLKSPNPGLLTTILEFTAGP
jgi:hypothetical protein